MLHSKRSPASPGFFFGNRSGKEPAPEQLQRLAALSQDIARIRDLTIEYIRFVDSERLIGLLRQIQERQAKQPNGTEAAALVEQAVGAIRAAK